MNEDIRWKQRFDNFKRSLKQLDDAMLIIAARDLSDLEKQGVIQDFEYNYELAWNVMKDFYEHQGEQDIQGSRDAFRIAFKRGLVTNGDIWMQMIKSRAMTSHTYNEEVSTAVLKDIVELYYAEFIHLRDALTLYMNQDD